MLTANYCQREIKRGGRVRKKKESKDRKRIRFTLHEGYTAHTVCVCLTETDSSLWEEFDRFS